MIRLLKTPRLLHTPKLRIVTRLYSNIEDFNKNKTQYQFGGNIVDEIDEDDVVLNDPRLDGLKSGSPEYKDKLYEIQQEYTQNEEKYRHKFEFNERLKGLALGAAILVGAVSAHQLYMNYGLWKGKLLVDYKYGIPSSAPDLNDPKLNVKSIENLVAKLASDLDSKVIFKNSTKESGLYLFGAINGKSLPVRFSFFDNMLISDVQIKGDYLVVLNEKGELYHYNKKMKEPVKIALPYSLSKCELSSNFIYGLTTKGELIYIPRSDNKAEFSPANVRSWTGRKYSTFNKLPLSEVITEFSLGETHCLILGKSGKLYITSTSAIQKENNFGQLGLPQWSPLTQDSPIPINSPVELAMLNNQVVQKEGIKLVVQRHFVSIASGKYHNVVSDLDNNLWAWGLNNYGQCAIDPNHITTYQPLPRLAYSKTDLEKQLRLTDISVDKVYAGEVSTFVKLNDKTNEMLVSLGNGIKGQMGNNQYLQLTSKPQVVRSLINLQEFDESTNKSKNIGLKDISIGDNHIHVTLDNGGGLKDVLAWGDNEFGQLGNGKRVKSAKPGSLPQLVEPEDTKNQRKLARQVDKIGNTQLRLLDSHKLNNTTVEQVVYSGDKSSAIYYKLK